jgi:hypothetical protein
MRSLFPPFLMIQGCSAFLLNGVRSTRSLHYQPLASKVKAPVLDDVCETLGVTLTRFMNEVTMLNPELRELTTIFGAIDTACKAISNEVKRSPLPSSQSLGYQGDDGKGDDPKARL